MKILLSPAHYSFTDSGGSELAWTYDLVSRLAERNKGSVVVTGFKRLRKEPIYKVIELTPKRNRTENTPIKAVIYSLLYSFKTISLLRQSKFDIAHHVLPFGLGRTFNLAVLLTRRTPFVIGPVQSPLDFSDAGFDPDSPLKESQPTILTTALTTLFLPIASRLSDLTLARASCIIVPHQRTMNLLQKRVSDPSKIVIIPMGIDTKQFVPLVGKKLKTKVVFLTASYLIKRKNIECIIRALQFLKDVQSLYTLRIVGDGPERQRLENLVESLGVNDSVLFEGWASRDSVISIYQQSDACISMSYSESFSNVCLEAMASGLPMIATKVGCFEDVINNGANGFVVEQNDDKSLAQKMRLMINDREGLVNMQANARKKMLKDYDWDTVVIPQFMNLYKSFKHTENRRV